MPLALQICFDVAVAAAIASAVVELTFAVAAADSIIVVVAAVEID